MLAQRLLHALEIGRRLCQRLPGPDAADAAHEARFANPKHAGRRLCGNPDIDGKPLIGTRGAGKRRGNHADNRVADATDDQTPADRALIPVVAPSPQLLTDDGRVRTAEAFLVCRERASGQRLHAEHRKKPRRDAQRTETLRLEGARVGHAVRVRRRQRFKRVARAVPVFEPAGGDQTRLLPARRIRLHDGDKAVRSRERQWAKQDRIHHREHRRRRCHAEGKSDEGGGRERGPARKRTAGGDPRHHGRFVLDTIRRTPAEKVPRSIRAVLVRERFKGVGLGVDVDFIAAREIWKGGAVVVAVQNGDNAVRITITERLQQHAVNHAEHRGDRAHADGERHKGDGAEGAAFTETANGETEVLQELCHTQPRRTRRLDSGPGDRRIGR